MPSKCRIMIHYRIKPGMEEKLMSLDEKHLLKVAQDMGFHHAEFWQDEKNPTSIIFSGVWDTLEAAQSFRPKWEALKPQLMECCTEEPNRELYHIAKSYPDKPEAVGYRILVHYHVKPGMEQNIMSFTENELLKTAQDLGFHQGEFWQDEKNPSHIIASGTWKTLESAQDFQSIWESAKPKLMEWCSEEPYREIYHIAKSYPDKSKKAA